MKESFTSSSRQQAFLDCRQLKDSLLNIMVNAPVASSRNQHYRMPPTSAALLMDLAKASGEEGTPETVPALSFAESGLQEDQGSIASSATQSPMTAKVLFEESRPGPPLRRFLTDTDHNGASNNNFKAQKFDLPEDGGITSDEEEDDDNNVDEYEKVLGMRSSKHPYPSPVQAARCGELHISPNFAELFKVFERPSQADSDKASVSKPHNGKATSIPFKKNQVFPVSTTALVPRTLPPTNAVVARNQNGRSAGYSLDRNETGRNESGVSSLLDSASSDAGVSTTSTEVTSNTLTAVSFRIPHVQVLEREVETLKSIMRQDSLRQVMLQKEVDSLQGDHVRLVSELASAVETVDSLKREREAQIKMDAEQKGRLQDLQKQVKDLSSDEEIMQLRQENELFAAQIVENENRLRAMQNELDAKPVTNDKQQALRLAQENTLLLQQIIELEEKVKYLQEQLRLLPPPPPPKGVPLEQLLQLVNSLESRLAAVEEERELARMSQVEKKSLLEQELDSIKHILDHKETSCKKENEATEDPIEVEDDRAPTKALKAEETNTSQKDTSEENTSIEDSSPWDSLCGCFVPSKQSADTMTNSPCRAGHDDCSSKVHSNSEEEVLEERGTI